jgi:hypothetical protein
MNCSWRSEIAVKMNDFYTFVIEENYILVAEKTEQTENFDFWRFIKCNMFLFYMSRF